MNVESRAVDPVGDRSELAELLSGNSWPFHEGVTVTREQALRRIADGAFGGPENKGFVIEVDSRFAGVAVVRDIGDPTGELDLRLAEAHRNRGIARRVLPLVVDRCFTEVPSLTRIEGNTRGDNIAMQRVFVACGWVKEAHYRDAGTLPDGSPVDVHGYAVIRRDWEQGTVTRIDWTA